MSSKKGLGSSGPQTELGPAAARLGFRSCSSPRASTHLFAVDPAQVAVPADGYDVGEQHPVRQRHIGEVDHLDEWPDHPVGLERGPPRLLEPLLGALALHGGHAAEEDSDHDGREEQLVTGHAREHFNALVPHNDLERQESKPGGSHGSEHAYAPTGHAAGPGEVMGLGASPLDELLGRDIAGREQHGGRDARREEGTGGQFGVVPGVEMVRNKGFRK
ncbi:hypothetical protein S7711_10903 [Stachybotrys chartarum IBT 7711]|uniref:Uncharacterized protein n=1 Tax=Stachybotrys chartarum (strain CBS 109288 / IBT 7711) TaxID=1280523 RepID=A0A084AMG2_STACB|nr:hypothetical protein S7711_10903 [Stachybotrys chartarum IBT 7711]KFA79106.1 hypothetical protein S40288_11210 [Stachybotrys chartarum IBT 40288]